MKKTVIPLFVFLLTGCPLGDRVPFLPAEVNLVDEQLCVAVDEEIVPAPEKILRVRIWSYEAQKEVYTKNLAYSTLMLDAHRCAQALEGFHFVEGKTYSVSVDTSSHHYVTHGFTVLTSGDEIAIEHKQ
ncbi:putative T6SS immunity periplasmic lipoprotein [Cronobacter turicensis]|nr:hypothetical protein [Cronobacter turicensis]ELQ6270510.1 hypothetical protein [Cronobacter turicensis]